MRTLISSQYIKPFLFAGKCVFTLVDNRHNIRTTYKIRKKKDMDIAWVSVQCGNEYNFAGTLFKRFKGGDYDYKHSPKSKVADDAASIKYFKALLNKIDNLPDFIEIHHAGQCGCCGRELTVPESLETGFGPVCFKRHFPNKDTVIKNRYKVSKQLNSQLAIEI